MIDVADPCDIRERRLDLAVRGVLAQLDVDRVALELGLQLLGRSGRHHLAAIEDRQAGGELIGLLQVVGGEQDGQALLVGQALDLLPHFGAHLGVEAGRRLVQEEHLRPVHERGGDVEPPLHPARVVAGDPLGRFRQAELLEQLVDPLPELAPVDRADQSLQAQVLAPVQVDVDARGLPDDADRLAHLPRLRDRVEAGHTYTPGGGEGERGRDLDRRRLAGAVRPEQPEDRAGGNREVDAVEGANAALVDLDQALWPRLRSRSVARRRSFAGTGLYRLGLLPGSAGNHPHGRARSS